MDQFGLIPTPDTIPAPAWVFLSLDLLTFTLHILLINVVLGGSILLLWKKYNPDNPALQNALANKVPTSIALGVNLGVAPLLFLQVIYGHLFYTSSVLMATFWIMVIPLLIMAYYGAYIHAKKYASSKILARSAIIVTVLFLLYIAFMFVNNMSLMVQPEKWTAYFDNRTGTILNLTEPTLWPRYLHFVTASVAVAGLFLALVWSLRKNIAEVQAAVQIKNGLKIFGVATIVQVVIGLWWLMALPSDFILQFMGRNLFYSLVLLVAFLSAIGAIVTAFLNKLRPTIMQLVITIMLMVINRHNLRSMYLEGKVDLDTLQMTPQYDVMALFFVVLIIGLALVWYMFKAMRAAQEGRAA